MLCQRFFVSLGRECEVRRKFRIVPSKPWMLMVIASFLSLSPLYLWLSSTLFIFMLILKRSYLTCLTTPCTRSCVRPSIYTLEIMLVLFFKGVSKTKYGKIKANSSEESCEICMFWKKGLVTVQNSYGTFNNGLKMVKIQSKFWFCML